ncbi:MAG: dihydropteroate synthase [Desulfovibrio sp.]|nr:dihydropteroate synthase [Desulfovibrio sp.]MBI4960651.1 dihydropteroate synthase [Desulfovibrio sp.]
MHGYRNTATGDCAKGVTWTVKGGRVLGPVPFLVMGIVNVTPDSFSDGGISFDQDQAVAHAARLVTDGADIVDIGGESTRPFADTVSESEEMRRVLPVIERVLEKQPQTVVSVDTYKANVADRALTAGAAIVNDVSACAFDPALADVLAEHKPGYVLMHSLGRPATMQVEPVYSDVVAEISRFFESNMKTLVAAGLPEDRIVLDPGIGFGKTLEHNMAILRGLESFTRLGRPVLMGLSNKSFFGKLLGLDVGARGPATQVATALCQERGAAIHRVHDVAGAVQALTLAEAFA